jgi:hypothetical protein
VHADVACLAGLTILIAGRSFPAAHMAKIPHEQTSLCGIFAIRFALGRKNSF